MPQSQSDDFLANYFDGQERQASGLATAAMYDDHTSADAGRAIELGKVTGTPPIALVSDLPAAEREHRSMLSSELIRRNQFLQNYFNSDPMAAKLSKDEVGQLDEASEALTKFHASGAPLRPADQYTMAGLPEAIEGFKEGFMAPTSEKYKETSSGFQITPLSHEFANTKFGKTLGGAAVGFGIQAIEAPIQLGLKAVSGAMRAVTEGIGSIVRDTGNDIGINGDLLARDLAGLIESDTMGMTGRHGMPSPEMHQVVKGAISAAEPWLRRGEMPPVNIHPWWDSVYKEAAKEDAKQLDDMVKKVSAIPSTELAPEFIADNFIAAHGDATIHINADAVARLYGSSRPEPDDALLGWVPNLRERLDATAGRGGDISVPLKDFLVHVGKDPELYKELKDDIRVRDHGFTLREAEETDEQKLKAEGEAARDKELGAANENVEGFNKALDDLGGTTAEQIEDRALQEDAVRRRREREAAETPEQTEARIKVASDAIEKAMKGLRTLPGHLQVVRGSAGLEPLMAVGDRKLTIQRRTVKGVSGDAIPSDAFKILDEDGASVGWLDVTPFDGGKKIYVDNIGGMESKGYHPNSFGPSLIRALKEQLKKEYPNMEQIGGFRISGAREKAGTEREVWIKAALDNPDDVDALAAMMAEVHEKGARAAVVPGELWTAHENEIANAVHEELERIAPGAGRFVVKKLDYAAKSAPGQSVKGLFLPRDMTILVSLDSKDPLGFAGHEAVHYLREAGFFTDQEWAGLEATSKRLGWQKKFNIDKRYAKYSEDVRLEESIAEGFRDWGYGSQYPTEASGVFAKLKELFDRIKARLRAITGNPDFDWKDLFQQIETGEVGARELGEGVGGEPRMATEEPEPIQVRLPFAKGKSIGMRQDVYNRYMKLIQARHEADLKADFANILDKERRTQTKEWKDNAAAIRGQVSGEISEKPNVILDRLLSQRGGELKIDPMSLREDLREVLPPEYMRRTNSMSADDLAGYFGYPSGDALVEHLAELTKDRQESGLNTKDYYKKMEDDEVQRRMEAQFGFLEKNVLEEAKDRALSQNQIDILDMQIMALAEHAKLPLPLERSAIERGERDVFNATPVGTISSSKHLAEAGKAMKEVRDALLKDDFQEALKAEQRHFAAAFHAKMAHEYEKSRKQLDKAAKRWGKVSAENIGKQSVEPEFINHIQDQLRRVGYKTPGRSWDNIRENIGRQRENTLDAFLQWHLTDSNGLRDMPVGDFMLDPNFQKPVDALTAEEFGQFKNAIDGLVANGRGLKQFGKEGEKLELEAALDEFIGKLQTFDEVPISGPEAKVSVPRRLLALFTSMPTVFNRFDRGDKRGPFNQLMYRFFDGANGAAAMEREVAKNWTEAMKELDLNKKLAPPPMMPEWSKYYTGFTNQNKLAMILNAGNKSNWDKLVKGWGLNDKAAEGLKDWLHENSTREEWQAMQKMGDTVFNKIVDQADKTYEQINGSTIDKIPLTPFEIEFNDGKPPLQLNGWYHRLIPDANWYAEHNKQLKGGFDDTNTYHIATSNGYTRARVRDAHYPLDLSFGRLPGTLSQMIWDTHMREVVLDAQKVMNNPRFLNAITKHYGKEYSDLMVPFLQDMAGQMALPTKNMAELETWSEFLRGNTMITYIGGNLGTPIKHGVTALGMSMRAGGGSFAKEWARQWFGFRPEAGNPWKAFALKNSEELQRRERNFQETFGGTLAGIKDESTIRERFAQYATKMVAFSDKASATALWISRYQDYLQEGSNAREAIDLANSDVRRQHGSTAWPNKPEFIRRQGALQGWATTFYGFMGERFQRLLESAQRIDDTWKLMEKKDMNTAARELPRIAADYASYLFMVGLGEEAASYALSEDHRSGGAKLFDLLFGSAFNSVPYLRDMYGSLEHGREPGIGLLPSFAKDVAQPVADVKKVLDAAMKGRSALNKQQAGKYIQDLNTAIGVSTGKTSLAVGNVLRFGTDVATGTSHPKSITDYWHGITRGHTFKEQAK